LEKISSVSEKTWIGKFLQSFLDTLQEANRSHEFLGFYNKGGRKRTILMLGTGAERRAGAIHKTLTTLYGRELNLKPDKKNNIKNEISFDRYSDCIVYKEFGPAWDDWYRGEIYHDAVIEVENNVKEFRGTFCDLLRIQGRHKVGIFYYGNAIDKEAFLSERIKDVTDAMTYFNSKGFAEAEGTEYLVVLLPETLIDKDNFLGLAKKEKGIAWSKPLKDKEVWICMVGLLGR